MGRSRASLSQSSRLTKTCPPRVFDDAKSKNARPAPSSLRKQGSRAEQSDSCFRRNDRCGAAVAASGNDRASEHFDRGCDDFGWA